MFSTADSAATESSTGRPLAADRVADGLARMNLSPAPPAPGASTRLHLAAGNAAATFAPLVRRFRMGPKAQAYARQKFPGITLDEVRAALAHLAEVSGRWCSVRADPMAARYCFRIHGTGGGMTDATLKGGLRRAQPLLRGLPGVDGAMDALAHSPKNLGPDQRAPVMTWAILESDR